MFSVNEDQCSPSIHLKAEIQSVMASIHSNGYCHYSDCWVSSIDSEQKDTERESATTDSIRGFEHENKAGRKYSAVTLISSFSAFNTKCYLLACLTPSSDPHTAQAGTLFLTILTTN